MSSRAQSPAEAVSLSTDFANPIEKAPDANLFPGGRYLPPKQLKTWGRWADFRRHLGVAVLASSVMIGMLVYSTIAFAATSRIQSDFTDDLCDKEAASKSEQRFVIDIRFGGGYSFAQAKLIDVAWDLLVGQGGRFLHGWILCHYVVSDALVWIMERSAVPYHYYTNLSFSTVSFWSLQSLGKMLLRKPGWRTTASATWMSFAIVYVLAFSTIWGAATGYISPSTRVYKMPDGALVSLDSNLLAMCWDIKDSRVGWADGHIEMGPSLKEIYEDNAASFANGNAGTGSGQSDVWTMLSPEREVRMTVGTSNNFRNIYAYALSVENMQRYLNRSGVDTYFHDTSLTSEPGPQSLDMDSLYLSWQGLPATLYGWQYTGIDQIEEVNLKTDKVAYKPGPEDWQILEYSATFSLDPTIGPGPGIVPYNSTFWYDGKATELTAPFLNLGTSCSPHNNYFTSLGSCVCYNGRPIPYDWYSEENMVCVAKRGYVWGFASFITLIALVIEATWAFGCWFIWLDANVNSTLLKKRRPNWGILRNALDLAESVNRDLGVNTCLYSDKELERELDKCEYVGYAVEERGDISHIGIYSEGKERPRLYDGILYG